MTYELWDMRSKNMIAYWPTATDAEVDLSRHAGKHGLQILGDMCLLYEDDNEDSHLVEEGEAILGAIKRLRSDELANHHQSLIPGLRAG
jgi:hypothetical protein